MLVCEYFPYSLFTCMSNISSSTDREVFCAFRTSWVLSSLTPSNKTSSKHAQVGAERFIKYITCGRDGSFRVWSAQTRRHITTVQDSTRCPPAWITCCVDLPDLTTPRNTAGVLCVFSLERSMSFYDLNNFNK